MKLLFVLSLLCLAGIGAIAQTPPSGSGRAAPVVIVSSQRTPAIGAVDEDSVYWASDTSTAIKKVSKNGGVPTTLVTGQKIIQRIIADGDNIYFNADDGIKRVNKKGGAPVTLAKFIGQTKLYLEVDETNVYFVNHLSNEEQLMKISKGGRRAGNAGIEDSVSAWLGHRRS